MDSNDTDISTTTDLSQLRSQARQRFVGAAVLVLIAVIALPLVLDTKPRPVSADLAIEIQTPAATAPATAPAPTPLPAPVATPAPPTAVPDKSTQPDIAPVEAQKPAPVKPEPAKAAPEAPAKSDDGARAAALLNGSGYHIQAGSFTDKDKLAAVRAKLSQAAFDHYTQDAIAKDGTAHTRIRLGPFASQAEANNVAARISKLGIKTIVIKP